MVKGEGGSNSVEGSQTSGSKPNHNEETILEDQLHETKEAVVKSVEQNKLKNTNRHTNTDPLAIIQSECQKISKELLGVREDPNKTGNQSMGLLEKTTIRELLEQIIAEVQSLNVGSSTLTTRKGPRLSVSAQGCAGKIEFGDDQSTGDKIRSETDAEEQEYLMKIVDSAKSTLPTLVEGDFIAGKTTESILGSFPDSALTLVVKVGNYLESNLEDLEYSMPSGSSLELPQIIHPGSEEALTFSNPTTWVNGLFSYHIGGTNLRFVLSLLHNTGYVAFALAPTELPTGNNVFVFEPSTSTALWKTLTDRRWMTATQVNLVVVNGDIYATLGFKGGKKAVIEIDVFSLKRNTFDNSSTAPIPIFKPISLSAIIDGITIKGKTVQGIKEYILEKYGFVLEVANLLPVALKEPLCYLENGQQPFIKPEMVSSGSREVLVVKLDNSGQGGLVTFKIGSTDLRLAVAFRIFNMGNKVAAAFVPSSVPTDANLMIFLMSDNQWKTSPDQKFAMAKDGDLVIQTRNIRAGVVMTDGLKAVLNIVIKTF